MLKGRGASTNPAGRFERLAVALDEPAAEGPKTRFLRDGTRSIIARNDSPDHVFDASINPYRGCEHSCVYCYGAVDGVVPPAGRRSAVAVRSALG